MPRPAARSAPGRRPVRLAVVGVGSMGRHHARVLRELPGVELAAVCDVDQARAARVAAESGARPYAELRRMLAAERLDAVSVAVPTEQHAEVGRACLGAGLHVLMEKPLAASVEQALALVAARDAAGRLLAAGHIERFNPVVRELRRRIERGDLGRITSILARRVGLGPPREQDRDIVVDLAIHDLDICRFLLGGEPTDVCATVGTARHADRFDHAEVFLDFAGVGCFVQANWITPVRIRTLAVTGEHAYAELDYVTQRLCIYRDRRSGAPHDFDELVARYGGSHGETVAVERREPLAVELAAFVEDVRGGAVERSLAAEEAVEALRLAERVLASLGVRRRPALRVAAES